MSCFSVPGFLQHYRVQYRVKVNNVFSPWLADDVILSQPATEEIIERRVRKKAKI